LLITKAFCQTHATRAKTETTTNFDIRTRKEKEINEANSIPNQESFSYALVSTWVDVDLSSRLFRLSTPSSVSALLCLVQAD
jgi:hypothetical protein